MNESSQPAASNEPPPKAASTILVVDDEEIVVLVLREILSRNGYEVVTARDSNEAIEQYLGHEDEIAAIILDVSLLRTANPENTRHLRALIQKVPILLSSGYPEAEAVRMSEFDEGGGRRPSFIQKPYTAPEILARLREIIGT